VTDPSHFALVAMQLVRGKVTPFLGAGVNLCDRRADEAWEIGRNLPSGRELALHLARSYQYPDQDTDLLRISQYVDAALGEGVLYEELRTLFAPKIAPTSLHAFLADVSPVLRAANARQQVLVTTNYDDLLEDAFAAAGVEFDLLWYEACGRFFHRGPAGAVTLIDRPNEWSGIDLMRRPAILKLHGAIGASAGEDSFVITEDNYIDYMTLSDVSTQIPMVVQDPLRNSHFVFMGYSLRDWNLRVVLNRLWGQQKLALKSWSVQLGATELDQSLWSSRGTVEIIPDNLSTYIAELRKAVDACVAALPAGP
jgi:SIR2-like domain